MLKASKSPTNGDIFINTKLYGIYNPKHFHSFQSTWAVFVPQVCAACDLPVYPFVQACVCLRCRLYCHRSCTKKQPPCSQFTFEHKVSAEPRKSFAHKDSRDGSSESDLQLHKIVEKACMIPAVLGYLPEPQSHFCIWQSVLRAVAMRQNHHTTKPIIISTNSMDLRRLDITIKPIIHSLLKDTNHFAGQICMVCLYVFLSLDFNNAGHIIAHARECLDTVVNSVWNICHIETHDHPVSEQVDDMRVTSLDETHELILQAIAFEVERFMLQEKECAMYDKINVPIRLISKEFTYNKHISFPSKDTKRIKEKTKEHWKIIKMKLLSSFTPIDKLRCLVDILHIASNNKYFRVVENRRVKKLMEERVTIPAVEKLVTPNVTSNNSIENNQKNENLNNPDSCERNESTMLMMEEEEEAVFVEDTTTPNQTIFLESERDRINEIGEEDDEDVEDGWKRYSSSDNDDDEMLEYVHDDNHCDADTLLENLTILLLADVFPHKRKSTKSSRKKDKEMEVNRDDAIQSDTKSALEGERSSHAHSPVLCLDGPSRTIVSSPAAGGKALSPSAGEDVSYDIPSQPFSSPIENSSYATVVVQEQSYEPKIDWLGECLFLSSPIISKAILDLNGMEGYALVTFQQVIQSLLIHKPFSHGMDYDTLGEDDLGLIPTASANAPAAGVTTSSVGKDDDMHLQQSIDFVSVNSFEKLWASVHHQIEPTK